MRVGDGDGEGRCVVVVVINIKGIWVVIVAERRTDDQITSCGTCFGHKRPCHFEP